MERPKHTFFAPASRFEGDLVRLPDDEAGHASRVLRLSPGDEVTVVDGAGGTHRVRLEAVSRKRVEGRVVQTVRNAGESDRNLSVGLALLKNRNRYETFLEKAVEIGVNRIVPLETRRTERQGFRTDRAESILISALKQSGRSRLPELVDVRAFEDEIAEPVGAATVRLIAHEAADAAPHIMEVPLMGGPVHVLVGPEGGFADDEVDAAADAGYAPVWMGTRRLRAETAAISAAAVLRMRMDRTR